MERERGKYNRCPVTSKVQCEDEDTARHKAKWIRKNIGPRLKAYLCPHCRFWHIGHDRPPKRREGTLVRKRPKRHK